MYPAETRRWLQLPFRRQSLFAVTFSFQAEHQDLFIPGAVPRGVEQHEIAARGASGPDGEGQVPRRDPRRGGDRQQREETCPRPGARGKGSCSAIPPSPHGACLHAELLKRLMDLCHESLTPSHPWLHLTLYTAFPAPAGPGSAADRDHLAHRHQVPHSARPSAHRGVRRLHAWIKVKQTIDPEEAEYAPHRIRRNHQAQLGAAFGGTLVSPHDGTRSRAITEPGRAHVDDHDEMAADGQGQLFRDTGRISQVDLFGQRHDHRAPRQGTSHGYHQLRGVWTKPGLSSSPKTVRWARPSTDIVDPP